MDEVMLVPGDRLDVLVDGTATAGAIRSALAQGSGPGRGAGGDDGDAQERACPDGRFVVETWFGAGSADFCVASLHPFELSDPASVADDWPRVRFGEFEATPGSAAMDG